MTQHTYKLLCAAMLIAEANLSKAIGDKVELVRVDGKKDWEVKLDIGFYGSPGRVLQIEKYLGRYFETIETDKLEDHLTAVVDALLHNLRVDYDTSYIREG